MPNKKQFTGMRVRELIEELKKLDQDAMIGYAYPAKDYWHNTIVSGFCTSELELKNIHFSDYHNAFIVTDNQTDTSECKTAVNVYTF